MELGQTRVYPKSDKKKQKKTTIFDFLQLKGCSFDSKNPVLGHNTLHDFHFNRSHHNWKSWLRNGAKSRVPCFTLFHNFIPGLSSVFLDFHNAV